MDNLCSLKMLPGGVHEIISKVIILNVVLKTRGAQPTFKYADVEDLELNEVRVGAAITQTRKYNRGLKEDIPPIRHTRKLVLERSNPMLKRTCSVAKGVS